MKKTILLLAALGVVAPQTSHADRFEIAASVGVQKGDPIAKTNTTGTISGDLQDIQALDYGSSLVNYPDTIAYLTNPANPLLTSDGQSGFPLQISSTTIDYSGNSWLGKSIPGVVAGGSLGYIMDIPCSPMFVGVNLGLYYFGSRSIINQNTGVNTMLLEAYPLPTTPVTYGLSARDPLYAQSQSDKQGKLANNLAFNMDVSLGASITKNVEVSLGVGYIGVRSKLHYISGDFKAYTPENNLTLAPGFITADNTSSLGQLDFFPVELKSKAVWQNGVNLSAAFTYKLSQSFAVRLKGQVMMLQAKDYEVVFSPISWATSTEAYKAAEQTNKLNIQNTITQTSVEFVYMIGVGSQPSAA